MDSFCSLDQLLPGQRAIVRKLTTAGAIRRRFLDLGLLEQTEVLCLGKSPAKDPAAYLIRGAVIAIRRADARKIIVERFEEPYEI